MATKPEKAIKPLGLRESHGVPNAAKRYQPNTPTLDTQAVRVTDGHYDEVLLLIGTGEFPAGLSPDQAEMIATFLWDSAERIRERGRK